MSRLYPPLLVLVVWLALWGDLSWANLASGLLVVALVGLMIRPVPRRHKVNPVALVVLVAIFFWRLITSSAIVVRTVLFPTPERLRSGLVAIPLRKDSPLVATVVADAISLTPGTLTMEVRGAPPVLYVHVLGLGDPQEIRDDVRGLEDRVLAALRPLDGQPVGPAADDGGAP